VILPVVAGILFAFCAKSQQAAPDEGSNIIISTKDNLIGIKEQDHDSRYPGGSRAWMDFLINTMHYPQVAEKEKVEGAVVLQFTVEADGSLSNIEAISGPTNGGLREEAIRVMKASGKWLPAIKNDNPVASVKKQPFVFRLSNKEKAK
jgi:TonB family protein